MSDRVRTLLRTLLARLAPRMETPQFEAPKLEPQILLDELPAAPPLELNSLEEVQLLLRSCGSELKKLDETLKVLNVYLQRVRRNMRTPSQPRVLH